MPKQKQTEPDKVTTETTAPTEHPVPVGPPDRKRKPDSRKAVKISEEDHRILWRYLIWLEKSQTAEQVTSRALRELIEREAPECLEPKVGRPRKTPSKK